MIQGGSILNLPSKEPKIPTMSRSLLLWNQLGVLWGGSIEPHPHPHLKFQQKGERGWNPWDGLALILLRFLILVLALVLVLTLVLALVLVLVLALVHFAIVSKVLPWLPQMDWCYEVDDSVFREINRRHVLRTARKIGK